MTAARNILFVSYAYPPMAVVGAQRIARLCRHLPEYGIRPTVLTVEHPLIEGIDNSFPAPANVDVVRTPTMRTPLDLYRRWKTRSLKQSRGGSTESKGASDLGNRGTLRRHLLHALQIPDIYWGWYWPAIRAANDLIKRGGFSAVVSSGPPWIGHLIALHIKKKHRMPWIADFRDAWTPDPWRSRLDGTTPGWRAALDHRLESSCVDLADLVVCTTDRLTETYKHEYSRISPTRIRTLTNGVDGDAAPQSSAQPAASKRLLLHLGSLYVGRLRRIDTFCQALEGLVQARDLDPASFQVVFQGVQDASIERMAEEAAPDLTKMGAMEFRPRIGWTEAQKLLGQADILLIFQGDHTLSIPAKFFDYLQTGKPIFAVVERGALSDIIENTGSGLWAEPGNPALIGQKLGEILEWRPRSQKEIDLVSQPYQFRNLAGKLAEWIGQLSSASGAGVNG